MKYSRAELLVMVMAKEVIDYENVIIGQGVPLAAGAIAKKTHAPNAIILTEAGMIDIDLFNNMFSVADVGYTKGFSYCIDLYDVFTTIVNRGYCDLCLLGAAQIDKFGNVNTTVIGDYFLGKRSDMKLPGSGGANGFAGHCNRTVLTMTGGKFVDKLDYFTSPGWLTGGDSREKAGLPGGPSGVITLQGIFRFEETSKELYLSGLFPKTTIEEVKEKVPWDLKTAEDLGKQFEKIELPTAKDLEIIRDFEPAFAIGGTYARTRQGRVLARYYENGDKVV
ncbi:MAG: glutaconate CoA-transferase [archaeon]|nr:glutaconate CoA-transferase [archaeon]